ncbi:MAG: phosphate acyltransferase PlsX [bacterium]
MLDAMGGDRAPRVIVEGAVAAARQLGSDLQILLVGRSEIIKQEIDRFGAVERIEVVHAEDVVSMNEQPSVVLRKKKSSSMAVGLGLLQEGKAEGFISAGNTGAVVANALFILGRVKGVKRPAIATYVPSRTGGCILLDVGANIDCKPEHLLQYGIMGACYANRVLGCKNPRVGLINIGEESTKGTEVVQEAYRLLSQSDLNFVGNVEGRDLFNGRVDVAVCDGFVGNIILKFAESVVDMVYVVMKEAIQKTLTAKLGALLMRPAFRDLRARFDYAEYGSAPLLGVDGICTIAHGGSDARAIKNAIVATCKYVTYDVRSVIAERISEYEWGKTKEA